MLINADVYYKMYNGVIPVQNTDIAEQEIKSVQI